MLTIDASVYVAAARSVEPNHTDSVRLIGRVVSDALPIYSPCLALAETAAALARTTGDLGLVAAALRQLEGAPGLVLVDLTADRARQAADLATGHRLRGADSIYVQVAVEFGTVLLTWDREMLVRVPAAARTLTPADWLAANP